ncbi:MAG TPA: hypothetical protein VI504_02345 [Candidatus Eisenbacteria bacterium]|jgi:hypothetical protein
MRIGRKASLVTLLVAGGLVLGSVAAFAQLTPYDPLSLSCVSPSGTNTITLKVEAGASGAPAGFSLQWISADAFEANGGDPFNPNADLKGSDAAWQAAWDSGTPICKMSFSGQPSFNGNVDVTHWELSGGQFVQIQIGDLAFFDETGNVLSGPPAVGFSTNVDPEDPAGCGLLCGTSYVFRAFAHAGGHQRSGGGSTIRGRSDFSYVTCSTAFTCGGCVHTQGFWSTHGPNLCHNGNNADTWLSTCFPMSLGGNLYSATEVCTILNTPIKGNGAVALARQLIAATFNKCVLGAKCEDADIAAANSFLQSNLGSIRISPVGSGTLKPKVTGPYVDALNADNTAQAGTGCSACTSPARPFGTANAVRKPWGAVKAHYR